MEEESRYGDIAIKSDKSVEAHREKIYTEIERVAKFVKFGNVFVLTFFCLLLQ